jgi:hypothetical protein
MRRINGEIVAVRSCKVEGVVDPAPGDVGGFETFSGIVAARRLDIIHHQVEGCRGADFQWLFRFPYDDMGAAAELKDGKVGIGENRA